MFLICLFLQIFLKQNIWAKIARKIENVYGTPQDIEFAVKDDEIFILQSRPITT